MIQGFSPAEADGFVRLLAAQAKAKLIRVGTRDVAHGRGLQHGADRRRSPEGVEVVQSPRVLQRHKEGRAKARRTIPGRGVGKV